MSFEQTKRFSDWLSCEYMQAQRPMPHDERTWIDEGGIVPEGRLHDFYTSHPERVAEMPHMKQCQRVSCSRLFIDPYEVYCPLCRAEVDAQQQKMADEHALYDVQVRR